MKIYVTEQDIIDSIQTLYHLNPVEIAMYRQSKLPMPYVIEVTETAVRAFGVGYEANCVLSAEDQAQVNSLMAAFEVRKIWKHDPICFDFLSGFSE